MSKITPKNLSYDNSLPPFLQRLQANNNLRDGRNDFQSARPKKPRNPEDDAEDEPVYFDEESGETLTKKEWEEKDKAEESGGEEKDGVDGGEEKELSGEKKEGEKEKIAAIGVSKKRKAGKVVGAEDEDENEKKDVVGDIKHVGKVEGKRVEKGKSAKKGKKIKLSFGDDE
jgi:hypothetical protein